jgi:hypothetical protein
VAGAVLARFIITNLSPKRERYSLLASIFFRSHPPLEASGHANREVAPPRPKFIARSLALVPRKFCEKSMEPYPSPGRQFKLRLCLRRGPNLRSMMKADHVRHLSICPVCGKLGDERRMIKAGPMEWLAHDRCVFEQLGEGILNLPKEEQAKFTLAPVGPDMMRILIDARTREE